MELLDDILHSSLFTLMKRYKAGDYLFHQGQAADKMYFIVFGTVRLLSENGETESVEGVLETGQFLGEKVLTDGAPYQRAFSAQAETEVLAVEIGKDDVTSLEAKDPKLVADLLKTVIRIVCHRSELANFLIRGLRSFDPEEQTLQVIRYFSRTTSHKDGGFELSEQSIQRYVDIDRKEIKRVISELKEQGLLQVRKDGLFEIG